MFYALPFTLGLVAYAAAQQVHDVTVGGANGELTYNPEAISAQPGDQVVFHFQQKNHTATQSSFANPCGFMAGGFDSGFMPVGANVTDNFPTYTIQVKNTQPIWVYCKQGAQTPQSHCGAGMVFAVNCGADGSPNSFTNFKNAALAQGAQLKSSASASASTTYTAAYGGVTIAPPPAPSTVTDAITLASSTWTTTYASYPNSPAPTPASLQGNVIKVVVGGPGKIAFDPPHVSAQPRDTIVFEFQQKNHTVSESSFADPCRKLNANGVTGFDSGFFPVADNATQFPTWNLTINDTTPVWAYCRQAGHCGSGMVFAINSDESSGRNFSAFQALAMQLNGTNATSSATGSAASSTSTHASAAAPAMHFSGTAFALVFAALGSAFF